MHIAERLTLSIKNAKIPLIICLSTFAIGWIFAFFYNIPEEGIFSDTGCIFTIITSKPSLKYYLLRLICEIVVITLSFFSGFTIFSLPIIYLIVFYRGFLLGITLKAVITTFSVGGFIVGVIVVLPSFLIGLSAIICCILFSLERLGSKKAICIKDSYGLLSDYIICFAMGALSVIYILIAQIIVIIPLNYSILT